MSWGRGRQRCPRPGPRWEQLMLMWNFDFFFFFSSFIRAASSASHISEDQTLTGISALLLTTPPTPPTPTTTPTETMRTLSSGDATKKHGKVFKSPTRAAQRNFSANDSHQCPPACSTAASVHEQDAASRWRTTRFHGLTFRNLLFSCASHFQSRQQPLTPLTPLTPPNNTLKATHSSPFSPPCALVSHSRARRAAALSTAGREGRGCPCPSSGQREFLKGPRVQKGVTVATPQTHDLSTLPRPVAGN